MTITDDTKKSFSYFEVSSDLSRYAISYSGASQAEIAKSMYVYTYKDATFETIDYVTSYNIGGTHFDDNDTLRTVTITDDLKKSVTYN